MNPLQHVPQSCRVKGMEDKSISYAPANHDPSRIVAHWTTSALPRSANDYSTLAPFKVGASQPGAAGTALEGARFDEFLTLTRMERAQARARYYNNRRSNGQTREQARTWSSHGSGLTIVRVA